MTIKIQEVDTINITTLERAREIMGRNLISPSQIEDHLGQHFSSHGNSKMVPFSEKFLQENSQNYILIRGASLGIEEIYKKAVKRDPHYSSYIFGDGWFLREMFAKETKVRPDWYLFQKRITPSSLKMDYEKAEMLLGPNEEIPTTCELFYVILLYYLTTHKRLFRGYYPFSRDIFLNNHLIVGFFPEKLGTHQYKLDIRHYTDAPKILNTGIVAIKKQLIS